LRGGAGGEGDRLYYFPILIIQFSDDGRGSDCCSVSLQADIRCIECSEEGWVMFTEKVCTASDTDDAVAGTMRSC
jgi:hypothetical protein